MVVSDKNAFTAKEAMELAEKIKVITFMCDIGKYGLCLIFYSEEDKQVCIHETDGGCIACVKSYESVKDLMFRAVIDARHFLKTDKDLNYVFNQLQMKSEFYTFNDHTGRKEIVEMSIEDKVTDKVELKDDEILIVFKKHLAIREEQS